jgi:uncharacterized protein YqhQ
MHAATHKVLNAYEFLKSVPNTDEAKKYSSFTENCNFTFYVHGRLD